MEKAKVFFTDFRAQLGDSLPSKLKRLIKKAGMEQLELDGKLVKKKSLPEKYADTMKDVGVPLSEIRI